MARFLLMAMPFTGHVTPLVAVAGALVRRGHHVRVYTGGAFRGAVEAVGATHVPWRAAPDFDERDLPATFPRLVGKKGLAQLLVNMQDLFIATGPAQLADLEAEWRRTPWDALLADEASIGPRLVAERLGCPWGTVAVLPLYLASGEGPPSGAGIAPGTNLLTRGRDAALRAVTPALERPLNAAASRARASAGLPPSRERFGQSVFSPDLVLASGVPALDYGRTDRPDRVRWVGRLALPAPVAAPPPGWWGDLDGRRVVVVTQGTFNIDPAELLRPALDGLADLDLVVIALTGVAGRDELPFPVPAAARVAGFLPFDLLLPRADAVVTNGGWGGTLAALAHGRPVVLGGADLDKPEVAARVAAAGAGVNLRTATPAAAAVRAAVQRVLADPGYGYAARRVAGDLAGAGGAERAAALAEELVPWRRTSR